MNKKLMLLAAAALSALAFAAVPTVASAGEYEAHCEDAAGNTVATCNVSITGGFAELSDTTGLRIHCKTVSGTGSFTTTTSTGTVAKLEFKECTDFVFGTECNNQGAGTKQINTNALVSHIINIEHGGTTPGVLLTGISVTFDCPALGIKKTVTGNVIGHLEEPEKVCNKTVTTFSLNFEKTANGQQKYKQVTTTGTIFDLISKTDTTASEHNYITAAQTGTGTLHVLENRFINITC
ncbi:MAG TPA: hypothetical protein VNC16_00510 [Solirubrobacterales bacterium]|jgi:hypothetical protein|nr:hypothetical protein [Solirubrobacterales bacterium]